MDNSRRYGHGPSSAREGPPALRGSYSDLGHGTNGPVEIYTPRGQVTPDTHVNDRDILELTSRFRALSTSTTDKAVRPGFGTRGAAINVRANIFQLNYPKDVILHDYAMNIEPHIRSEEEDLRKHVIGLFEKSKEVGPYLQGIVLDGTRRLIAKQAMPKGFSVTVKAHADVGKGTHSGENAYAVTLVGPKELKSAELARFLRCEDPTYNPIPILSAFNLIVTSHAARTGVRASGKHAYFFAPDSESGVRARAGIAVVNGFFATVRPIYKSLMVNVNTCMSAFYVPRDHLSDAMLEFLRQSQGAAHPQKFFGKMRVTTNYLGYRKHSTIKGFGSATAKKTTFQSEELGKVTVEKYFQKKFGISLKHADDLPVVNIGTKDRDVFVPAEVCRIEVGSLFTGELTRRESASLCAANCKTPAANAQTLTVKGLRLLGFESNTPPMASFGIKISLDMAVISARVLSAPKVNYQSGQLAVVNGSWTTRGIRFAKAAQLTHLAVLVLRDGGPEDFGSNSDVALREVIDTLLAKCHSCGMQVSTNYEVRVIDLPRATSDDPFRDQALREVSKALNSFPGKPKMVLTLVSNKDPHIYAGLKTMFDTVLGCQALCALMSNIREKEGQDQYMTNLALKLNAKLGGLNHTLESGSLKWLQNTMLVGMDVTHPGAGCIKGTPTIAAVAASCDMNFTQYPASVSLQEYRKETITNAKNMIIERLKEYRQHMKALPERIVIFRGGVSDNLGQDVMRAEVGEMKKAFRDLADYKPKVTFVICGKGHRTRFYPTRAQDADQTSNSKAGTVVDQGVTGIYDFDFYLQAHSATQGMVRATRYTVLYDENKFSADVLQQGINDISHLWAPASNSVSLIPPAYWVDRACKRARLYLHKILPPIEGSKESKVPPKEIVKKAEALWGRGVHEELKGTMYYM